MIVDFWTGFQTEAEIVPVSWFNAVDQICWWPPTSFSKTKVTKSIISSMMPDETWSSHSNVTCVATFSTCLAQCICFVRHFLI